MESLRIQNYRPNPNTRFAITNKAMMTATTCRSKKIVFTGENFCDGLVIVGRSCAATVS